jgi:hypothetical protein
MDHSTNWTLQIWEHLHKAGIYKNIKKVQQHLNIQETISLSVTLNPASIIDNYLLQLYNILSNISSE